MSRVTSMVAAAKRRAPGRNRGIATAVAALWLCLATAPAGATVTCSVSTPGLAFGSYDVFSAATTYGTAALSITCSLVPPSNDGKVSFVTSLSTGSSMSFVQRTMKSGPANSLNYNLYTSNAYSVVWGDGTGATRTVSGTMMLNKFTNPSQTNVQTVYGQIPPLQDAAVGNNYLDNVTVTVNY